MTTSALCRRISSSLVSIWIGARAGYVSSPLLPNRTLHWRTRKVLIGAGSFLNLLPTGNRRDRCAAGDRRCGLGGGVGRIFSKHETVDLRRGRAVERGKARHVRRARRREAVLVFRDGRRFFCVGGRGDA